MTRFCIICGMPIIVRYSMGRGHYVSICRDRSCIAKYLAEFAKKGTRIEGFCGSCGKPILLSFLNSHYQHTTKEACISAPMIRKRRPRSTLVKKPHRVHIKPWKNPDSLFCSPKLGKIVGKEIARGDECSG